MTRATAAPAQVYSDCSKDHWRVGAQESAQLPTARSHRLVSDPSTRGLSSFVDDRALIVTIVVPHASHASVDESDVEESVPKHWRNRVVATEEGAKTTVVACPDLLAQLSQGRKGDNNESLASSTDAPWTAAAHDFWQYDGALDVQSMHVSACRVCLR